MKILVEKGSALEKLLIAARDDFFSPVPKGSIWIDLTSYINTGNQHLHFDRQNQLVFILLPPEKVLNSRPIDYYESFSFLLEQSKGLKVFIIMGTDHAKREFETIVTLFKMDVQKLVRDLDQPQYFLVSGGKIYYWNRENFTRCCLAGLGSIVLRNLYQLESEESNISLVLTAVDTAAIVNRTGENLNTQLAAKRYLPVRGTFNRLYGQGRQRLHRLLEHVKPDILEDENRLPQMFGETCHPETRLLDKLKAFIYQMLFLYKPVDPDLSPLEGVELESIADTIYLPTPLWQQNLIYLELNKTVNEEVLRLENEVIPNFRQTGFRDKRRIKNELFNTLVKTAELLRQRVDEEISAVRELDWFIDSQVDIVDGKLVYVPSGKIVKLSPDRLRNAYYELYDSLLRNIVEALLPNLWRLRTLAGIPLGLRMPSLFFHRRGFLTAVRSMVFNIMRLLNFYSTTYRAVTKYWNLLDRARSVFEKRVPADRYIRHIENIHKELRKMMAEEPEPEVIQYEHIISDIQPKPFEFPDPQKIIDMFNTMIRNDHSSLMDLLKELTNLAVASRKNKTVTRNPLIPGYFYKCPAFQLPNEIVEFLTRQIWIKTEISKEIQKSFQTFGPSSDTACFFASPKIEPQSDLKRITFLTELKKKALAAAKRPLQHDTLAVTVVDIKAEQFIDHAIRNEFFIANGRHIGLSIRNFARVPVGLQMIYYEKKRGLSRRELNALDTMQKKKILEWLMWVYKCKNKVMPIDPIWIHDSTLQTLDLALLLVNARQVFIEMPEHIYFGKGTFYDDNNRFILHNTQEQTLWPCFAPVYELQAKPRYFSKRWLETGLRENRHEYLDIYNLYTDYMLLREDIG